MTTGGRAAPNVAGLRGALVPSDAVALVGLGRPVVVAIVCAGGLTKAVAVGVRALEQCQNSEESG